MTMDDKEIIVAAIQMRVGRSFEANLEEVKRMVNAAAEKGATIVALPEYFYLPQVNDQPLEEAASETFDQTFRVLNELSREREILLEACLIERDSGSLFNTAFLFRDGEVVGCQRKVHVTAREIELGISRWDGFDMMEINQLKLGILVCADVLYPEACRVLGLFGCDIVINPVVSFYHDVDVTKDARECLFVSRAIDNDYFLIKPSGIGKTPWGRKIVGRSLIVSPWGVIARYENENRPQVLTAALDLNLLRKLRRANYSLTDRVKAAYKPLIL
jgi:predicted amidohydrolase